MYPQAERNKKNKRIILMIILVLIFGAVIYGFYHNFFKSSTTTNITSNNGAVSDKIVYVSTPEDLLKVMRSKGGIIVPQIGTEKSASINDLISPLNSLILSGATEIKVRSVVYKGKSKGFVIDYTATKPIKENFDIFHDLAVSPWKIIYETHSNLSALVNFESSKHWVLSELSKYGPDASKIRVYIINK